jgi:hypothetical protein
MQKEIAESIRKLIPNNKDKKKLANHTYAHKIEDGEIVIRLHQTDIIKLRENGDIVLNSGGWKTMVTENRINEYIKPYQIYSDKGIWYLTNQYFAYNKGSKDSVYTFADGMYISGLDGLIVGSLSSNETKMLERKRKEVREYASDFMKAFSNGDVPPPSSGDCFFCLYHPNEKDHLISHIKEKYFVPSLLQNVMAAIPTSGYEIMMIKERWSTGIKTNIENNWLLNVFKRKIVKYLYKQLGL